MKRHFVYEVQEFIPPDESRHLGGHGFGIYLDANFARQAKNFVADDVVQNRFQEFGKDWIIKRLFKKDKFIRDPYMFVENSLLVQSIHVQGDACDLRTDWGEIEYLDRENSLREQIQYSPHNVDSVYQAYALFSLFSKYREL